MARKIVYWNTEVDLDKGTIPSTLERSGTGDDAIVRLKAVANSNSDIGYETPGEYTPSDETKVEIASGSAKLKALSGSSSNWPFTISGNYNFAATDILVVSGKGKLLDNGSRVGQWHLNESSGTNAVDVSGNGNDGTTQNMEDGDWIAGHLNNGLNFGGTNEFLDMGDMASFERTQPFTVEFWIKTNYTVSSFLVGRLDSTANVRGWFSWMKTGGKLLFGVRSSSGNRLEVESTTATLNDNSFHHVVITYDGSSAVSGITAYIDGSSIALTTISDTLTATTINSVSATMGKYDGGSAFQGILDEVVIYDEEITSVKITNRYNSGTGTEGLRFDNNDPALDAKTELGFVYSAELTEFTETVTTPANTEIRYWISSDNGISKEYWSGSAWVASDGSYAQMNTAATINSNISTFTSSGTFNFGLRLRTTDGVSTPEIDNVLVAESLTFSTTDNLYIDTKDTSQVASSNINKWLTATISSINPSNTNARILFSIDGRISWLTWGGAIWDTPTSATMRTDGTSLSDAVDNFSSLQLGDNTLDIRLFLQTSDASVTPSVSNINITLDAGFETSGVYETNIFDSTYIDLDWEIVTTIINLGSGGTVTIKAKSANSITKLDAASYGSAITDGSDAGVVGRYIKFEITIVGDGTETTSISRLCINFQDPIKIIVTP